MGRLAFLATALAVGVAATSGIAGADIVPTADLAVVSSTVDVAHAKIGDHVTVTIVATNNGPGAADFNVTWASDQLRLVSETCDHGISADTPTCEYGVIGSGVTLTTTVVAEVIGTSDKQAVGMGCMVEQPGFIDDPDPANDCATASVKIVGKR
jgi:uncharacterized repeat protein (TIGR01451 family)